MNKVMFPLTIGIQGPAVADLQAVLQLCLDRHIVLATDPGAVKELSAALKQERAAQTYGGGTGRIVGIFRGVEHLHPSGTVDEPTATALNALLAHLGLLVQPPVQPPVTAPTPPSQPVPAPIIQQFTVQGRIQLADGRLLAGATVVAFDEDLRAVQAFRRSAVTDGDGTFLNNLLNGVILLARDTLDRTRQWAVSKALRAIIFNRSLLTAV